VIENTPTPMKVDQQKSNQVRSLLGEEKCGMPDGASKYSRSCRHKGWLIQVKDAES
jgi:hypothetical protein